MQKNPPLILSRASFPLKRIKKYVGLVSVTCTEIKADEINCSLRNS